MLAVNTAAGDEVHRVVVAALILESALRSSMNRLTTRSCRLGWIAAAPSVFEVLSLISCSFPVPSSSPSTAIATREATKKREACWPSR